MPGIKFAFDQKSNPRLFGSQANSNQWDTGQGSKPFRILGKEGREKSLKIKCHDIWENFSYHLP